MTRILFLIISLCMTTGVFAQQEEALVKAVRAKLDKVNDYEASGQMAIDVSFIQAPKSDVTVYYKKPNQFKVVKRDGISILPKGGVGINLGTLLANGEYTVVPAGSAVLNGSAVKVVKLLPQDESGDVVLMTLYIDEKAALVKRTKVTTRENGSYEIDLSYGRYAVYTGYKINKGISNAVFASR
jgi:outer membrane lipoprotein-sorting protein